VDDDEERVVWNGTEIAEAIAEASVKGLKLAAHHLLQVSSAKAPHEEGTLERSGEVSFDAQKGQAAVSFDTPYAVVQHEDLTLRHDGGREAKFLERAMVTERDTLLAILAKHVKGAIDG
jgi:hypothetical protein